MDMFIIVMFVIIINMTIIFLIIIFVAKTLLISANNHFLGNMT